MRLPPALAASATPRILELLGEPPARVLELGFAGIHATPLRLAGFEVVVVEPDPAFRERAAQRAGEVLAAAAAGAVRRGVAPEGAGAPERAQGDPRAAGWFGMELRLVLTVDDFEQALAFYRDALGLPEREAWEAEGADARIAILDAGRATLELVNEAQAAAIDDDRGRRARGGARARRLRRRRQRARSRRGSSQRAPSSSPSSSSRRGTTATCACARRTGCSSTLFTVVD